MTRFLLERLAHAITVIAVVSLLTFFIIHLAPGGPSLLADPKLSRVERAAIERELGVDRPLPQQFATWVTRVARGDLGRSFLYQTPNVDTILARFPNTLLLAGSALLLSIVLAIPLGAYAAAHPGSLLDRTLGLASFTIMAVPAFWLGIGAILVFAVGTHLLPAGGASTPGLGWSVADRLRHLLLPAVVLSAATSAELFRYARTSAGAAFKLPLVRTVRAKGGRRRTVAWHALRNALIPVLTVIGLQLPRLVGGAAITETVFAWPGMGRLGVEAALGRDYPLVMAMTLFVSAAVVLVNIAIDLCYAWADPRIRLDATGARG
ncbi:MAG: Dipeptide transport system permease protein DppB [Gemmatimonadaceae bacterium]|nr:Dipeptide transport system permease protein DppB [Gemmatimonadaceae bacterium]